jgi:hypothetical protein
MLPEEMLERVRRGSGVVSAHLNDLIEATSTGPAGGVLGEYLRGVASPQDMDAAVEEVMNLLSGTVELACLLAIDVGQVTDRPPSECLQDLMLRLESGVWPAGLSDD